MATIFLLIIYLAFISLGLPDSLPGLVWPVMQADLGAPLDAAGLVTMTVSAATIFSSLMTERLVRWMGTGRLTAISGFIAARAGVFVIPALILVFVALIVKLSEQADRTTARHGAK